MAVKDSKRLRRMKIKYRIRKKIKGTLERPRLVVTKSNRAITAQIIDDVQGKTLASANSLAMASCNKAAAEKVGKEVAERAQAQGIQCVVFDRGGYLYHGVVKTLSETARANGLKH